MAGGTTTNFFSLFVFSPSLPLPLLLPLPSPSPSLLLPSISGKTTSIVITHQELEFSVPFGIAVYYRENCLFVTDKGYHNIKKITSSGTPPSSLSFSSSNIHIGKVEHFVGTGREGRMDGEGNSASFSFPSGIAVDQRTGNVFVAETGSHSIRIISSSGTSPYLSHPFPSFSFVLFYSFRYCEYN